MNDSALYLGIDGGQSGTRCLIVNEQGKIVAQGEAKKIDFVLAPGGKQYLEEVLRELLQNALPNDKPVFRSAFVGLSGVIKGGELEVAVRSVCERVFQTSNLQIDNDAMIAWAGALKCQPGIIVIGGSGSIALGVNHNWKTDRAGGWGFLFGDEGGGFGISRDGLKKVLHSLDANKPLVSLVELYTGHFGGVDPRQLVKDFYAGQVSRDQLALITPKLAELAKQGDETAKELFAGAARIFADYILAVASKLSWPSNKVTWAPVGGVFKSKEIILEPLLAHLEKHQQKHQFVQVEPALPPVAGAVLLAIQGANGFIDPRLTEQILKEMS